MANVCGVITSVMILVKVHNSTEFFKEFIKKEYSLWGIFVDLIEWL